MANKLFLVFTRYMDEIIKILQLKDLKDMPLLQKCSMTK